MSQCYAFPPTTIPSSPTPITSITNVSPSEADEFTPCVKCQFAGCDLKSTSCGCSFHTRCFPLRREDAPLKFCPNCGITSPSFALIPMTFKDIDEARKAAAQALNNKNAEKRGRKRKNSIISVQDDGSTDPASGKSVKDNTLIVSNKPRKGILAVSNEGNNGLELRTGRWTNEEMAFCDKLIFCFKEGMLPVSDGIKLNDFLASVLRSKQSRLTKKMKNAKLSANTYLRRSSYIESQQLCMEFSTLEDNFFLSINDLVERAELKFHMRKLWREMFSDHCLHFGQPLDVDAWLTSVEAMDKRNAMARDAARMQRRQLMMGYALFQDCQSTEIGVYIEKSPDEMTSANNNEPIKPFSCSDVAFNSVETDEMLALLEGDEGVPPVGAANHVVEHAGSDIESVGKSSILHNSPFLTKIINYIKRHNVPFEHVDVWVPNFQDNGRGKCILGFAGSVTADQEIPASGHAPAVKIESDAKFNLLAFGDYSQKFSFAVGCGLPGRVFESRSPTWDTGVNTGSNRYFERAGGAVQWGIKTVVALPIPSPNVGQIVVILYSRYDRHPNLNLLSKLTDEFSKLLPTPKWKLVIDMGTPSASVVSGSGTIKPMLATSGYMEPYATNAVTTKVSRSYANVADIVTLLAEEMSSNVMSNVLTQHCHNMISLRLLLLKPKKTVAETELVETVVNSFISYVTSGKPRKEIAVMISRDYAFMKEHQTSIPEVTLHHTDYNIGPPPDEYESDMIRTIDPNQFEFRDEDFANLDPHTAFFDGVDLEDFRPKSPALTPIEPNIVGVRKDDNLSVVSH